MLSRNRETTSDVVSLIARSLLPGPGDPLKRLFERHGSRTPVVMWSPRREQLGNTMLDRFWTVCETMRGPDGQLRIGEFQMDSFGGLQDWMMIVEPDGGGYRYAHYGAGIADHYGRDMTGMTTSDIGGHIQCFFEAVYRTAETRLEPVLTEHEPPAAVFVRMWRRLIVPVTEETGDKVAFFAVINLPENELRAGLDLIVDPVFVLSEDEVVLYANSAARKAFGLSTMRAPGPTLRQLTGLELGILPPLDQIFTDARIAERVELTVDAGIVERRRISVSAAEHRGRLYYVVAIQAMDI